MVTMFVAIAIALAVGLVLAPKQTMSLIGRGFTGTLSLVADVLALIFTV
jgi:hypothetical protein